MKRNKNRVLAMLVVLIMVLSIFPAFSFANTELYVDYETTVEYENVGQFFEYTAPIINRSVGQFNTTSNIAYLSGLNTGFADVVVGLVVEGRNWAQVTDDFAGAFARVLETELAPVEPGAGTWLPNTARTIVREVLIDIWGQNGLLHTNNVHGVAIPPVLFDLVATPHWEDWFMANRAWTAGIPVAQFNIAMPVPASDNTLAWNHANRITDVGDFFGYTGDIILRAIERFEDTGTLGYLTGLNPGFRDVVIGLAVPPVQNWNQVSGDLGGPFSRVLQHVLAPIVLVPTAVTVTAQGSATTVQAGSTLQFSASVAPAGVAQAVTWAVTGHTGATINASGLLTVAPSVPASTTLTITATATGTTVSNTATVTTTAAPVVNPAAVTVTPATATVQAGSTRQFNASVAPTGAAQAVTWTVTGHTGATINASGLLTVAASVPANTTLTITATATGTTIAGTATITTTAAPGTGNGNQGGNNNQGGGTTGGGSNQGGNNNQGGGTTGGGATGGGQPSQPQQPTPPTQEPSQPQQPTQPQLPRPTLQLIFTVGEASFGWHGINRTAVGAPFIDAATDRLMIPLRTVAEATGTEVRWDDATRSAVIYLATGALVIPVDQPLPDGMGSTIIVNDRVFVPARFVMEALGATSVQWYEADQQAVIAWY